MCPGSVPTIREAVKKIFTPEGCIRKKLNSCFSIEHPHSKRTYSVDSTSDCSVSCIVPDGTGHIVQCILDTMCAALFRSFHFYLETRRCGPLRGPSSSSCGGLRPRPFFALWAKKGLFMSVLAQILVIFGDQ